MVKSGLLPTVLVAATVPEHLRAFHLPWARRLREMGHTVIGAADRISFMPECVAEFDKVFDIEFSRNPLHIKRAMRASAQLSSMVRKLDVRIVHVHTPVAAFVTRAALRKKRVTGELSVIYTAHGFHFHDRGKSYTNFIFESLERLAGRWTDYLVVINHDDETAAIRAKIVPPERIIYMPGVGIEWDQLTPSAISLGHIARLRNELALAPSDKLLTIVAELSPVKRHRDVLEALRRLNRPDVHLAICGEGTARNHLENKAAELGLQRTVHFLGFRRDVSVVLRASLLSLLTSGREGLPRSVMESLALEVPVIGTNIRGVRDLLRHGAGLLVPVADPHALAQAMRMMLDDPKAALIMGHRGREQMRQYSLSRVLGLHEQLYKKVIENIKG